jgi:radical SAM superfamily enzyme YgiQ (UPF0313 family)
MSVQRSRGVVDELKIALVRPKFKNIWESLACGYIASYLEKHWKTDPESEIVFYDGNFEPERQILAECVDADYVAFSCTSPQMGQALRLACNIKSENPKVKTVFGGHHPSSLPEQVARSPWVDKVVVGEGERAMLEILEGKWIGKVAQSLPIEDLDDLPFPDRTFIEQERTLKLTEKNDGERIASILSGRGCLFHCIFCTGDRDVFGPKVRKRSVKNVLDEIEQLVSEWRIDMLKFADTEINTSVSWLKDFCHMKEERKITVPWGANVHARMMYQDVLYAMKSAGCREIWVGVESGSPHVLRDMRKAITIEMVENVFRWAKAYRIRTRVYFMTGFPTETREDFEATLDFAERLNADVYGMTIACPFPGTALYNAVQHSGVDWSETDEYTNDFWHTKHFTNEQLKQNQAEFMDRFKDRLCWRQHDS